LMNEVADRGARLEIGLGLLVSEGVPVGFSQMLIEAVMMDPNERVGRTLSLKTPSAALALTQTMYLTDGSPVQWSRDTFLPGHLNLHVVRELFEVRKLP
jgi:GntR family transcriptional regulator